MGKCPEPGEPGYVAGVFQAFALNIGLRLAGEVGLGLPLVNALGERFPDLDRAMIGEIAGLVGEGIRAGTLLTPEEMGQPVNPSALPIVSPDFHTGAAGDRIIAGVEVQWQDETTGETMTRLVWINALEILTPEDLLDEAMALFEADIADTNAVASQMISGVIAYLVFLATRY